MSRLLCLLLCFSFLTAPVQFLHAQETTVEDTSLAAILDEISADVGELKGHLDDARSYTLGFDITALFLLLGGGVTITVGIFKR